MSDMAKDWKDVRKAAIDSGQITEEGIKAASERRESQVIAYRLAELRKQHNLTQSQLAKIMHVDQSRISQIETGDITRAELPTVTAYINALGGSVKIVADFGDSQHQIA